MKVLASFQPAPIKLPYRDAGSRHRFGQGYDDVGDSEGGCPHVAEAALTVAQTMTWASPSMLIACPEMLEPSCDAR